LSTPGTNAAKIAAFSLSAGMMLLRYPACDEVYFMLDVHLVHAKSKMATAHFSRDEVLKIIFEERNGETSSEEDKRDDDDKRYVGGKIYLMNYDTGNSFNKELFASTANKLLSPLLRACESKENKVVKALLSSQINSKTCLAHESSLWLSGIFRRLAGRRNMRQPFYGQIHRDVPVSIFNALFEAIKLSDDQDFREPFCYVKQNSKGKIISLTRMTLVVKLFCLLLDRSEDYVNGLMQRKLGGQRKGFIRKVLVSYDKDFSLVYNLKKGQLSLQFHYGEWNAFGFPMHSCIVDLSDN
jgi:hypothetical protein